MGIASQPTRPGTYDRGVSPRPSPTRRSVLTVAAVAGAVTLAGCGIRRESDAPRLPGLATPAPPADRATLLAALSAERMLHAASLTAGAGWPARLAPVHAAQATRLVQVLASEGVTVPAEPPSDATRGTAPRLALFEARQVSTAICADAARASATNLPTLVGLLAVHAAAATALGGPPTWADAATSRVGVALVPSVRAAVYTLEVVAARTPQAQRPLVRATLSTMYAARSRVEGAAGDSAPAAPLGYRLAARPDSPAGRAELGRVALDGVVQACAAHAGVTRGSPADVRALAREWGGALDLAWRWGRPVAAFPGLRG